MPKFMQQFNSRLNSDVLRQLATLLAIVAAFGINVVSNIFPLNGLNIGEISNTLFGGVQIIPANYAFAIWGLIYVGLFALGIYQMRPEQRQNPRLRAMGYGLVIACLAQIVWVFLFLSRLFFLSVVAMAIILLALIGVYLRLEISKTPVSFQERWFVQIPISVYLGWISVAAIVNVASALYSVQWTGWGIGPTAWTVIMVLVATAIALLITLRHQDVAYVLVIVWALVAIALKQWNNSTVRTVSLTVAIALALLVLLIRAMRIRWNARSAGT